MSKSIKLSQLIKEESKTISVAVPASQYQILERLAEVTHRTITDVASQVFGEHTVPKIEKMLDNQGTDGGKKKASPKKVSNQPSIQTSLSVEAVNPVPPSPINPTRSANQAPPSQTPVSGFGSAPAQTPMQPRSIQLPTQPQSQPPLRPTVSPALPTTHPENE